MVEIVELQHIYLREIPVSSANNCVEPTYRKNIVFGSDSLGSTSP
jgi:hypothetical protein